MSIYSQQKVNTHYIEPSLHNANRSTEFRIAHQGKILPNLRLIEVGYIQNAAQTPQYNRLCGVKTMIKNIHLYDGKTTLSSLSDAPHYQGFKNFNQDVTANKSLDATMSQTAIAVIGAKEESNADIMQFAEVPRQASANTSAATGKAWIDLRDYFPVLKVLNHLDTENVFHNLRIVVEYELTSDLVVEADNRAGTANSPRLVYDAIEDSSQAAPNPASVSWAEIESDRFDCADPAGAAQTVNARINGFTNKSLGKLVMIKTLQDRSAFVSTNIVLGVGSLGSVAQQDEKVQLTINGTQRFPRDGLDSKGNRGVAMMVDLWGECSSFPFAAIPNVQNLGEESQGALTTCAGQISYITYDHSGERVGDFEVNYQRTGNTGAGAPSYVDNALTVKMYGEVFKTMTMSGNNYNIIYN